MGEILENAGMAPKSCNIVNPSLSVKMQLYI